MKVSFKIRSMQENKKQTIHLLATPFGERIKVYIREMIHPRDWNAKKQRAKSDKSLNDLLNYLSAKVTEIHREMKMDQNFDTSEFKQRVSLLVKPSIEQSNLMIDQMQVFVEKYQKDPRIKPSSVKKYTTMRGRVLRIKKSMRTDYFKSKDNIQEYVNAMYHLELSPLSIKRELANIPFFLREMGIPHDEASMVKIRKAIRSYDITKPYLNKKELDRLWRYKGSTEKLENARRLFLRGCYSGLRFQDWHKIDDSHQIMIGDLPFLQIFTQKASKKVFIPFVDRLEELLNMEVYDISDIKFNKYVKEVGEEAGLNRPFYNYEFIDLKHQEVKYKKWEKLSSHVGRYTWATNAYLDKVPLHLIRDVLGHRSDTTTQKYIKRCIHDGFENYRGMY